MKITNLYFAVVFFLLVYLLWVMMRPFVGAIIFASIISGSLYPVFLRFLEKTQLTRAVGSAIMCIFVVIIVFLPTIWLLFELSKEAVNLYQNLTSLINNESINNFLFGQGYFAQSISKMASILGLDISPDGFKKEVIGYIKEFSVFALSTTNQIVGNIVSFLFNFVVMILVIYTFLAEGVGLKIFLMRLSPLPDDQEELIMQKFNQMNFVTLVCNGIGGLIQGIFAGIGFWMAGINSVILLTTLMAILAFIPLLGISIIYIPVCLYLLLTGETMVSISLFIYCSAIAFFTENWFKPIFIGNRIQINSLLVLLCIIGGMSAFGVGGIFYGPLIAILFLTAVDLYYKYYMLHLEPGND